MVTRMVQAGVTASGTTVLLRAPKPDKAELSYGLIQDPVLMKDFLLGRDPAKWPLEEYRNLIVEAQTRDDAYSWWIYGVEVSSGGKKAASVGEPEFMGLVGINEIGPDKHIGDKRCGNLFYVLRQEWQKKGIARIAAQAAIKYAFAEGHELPPLQALRVKVVKNNERNMRFAEMLRFEKQRIARDYALDKKVEVWHGYRYP